MIDLRSDTVTLPTPAMRAAMAEAPLGDDQFGEDPSVNAPAGARRRAARQGGRACSSRPGTMANQLPLKLYCSPGDDVVVGAESHAVWHETGAAAANAGVQFTEAGTRRAVHGRRAAGRHASRAGTCCSRRRRSSRSRTPTTAWAAWSGTRAELEAVAAAAREHGAASYLDGARLLNAAAARGDDPAALAAPFDLVSIALSKGLGCPGGSVLAGRREDVDGAGPLPPDARRRDAPGGHARRRGPLRARPPRRAARRGPRQRARDRRAARRASTACGSTSSRLETNIVVFRLGEGAPDAATVVARARERGVLVMAFAARTVRAVTHLDVTAEDCAAAAARRARGGRARSSAAGRRKCKPAARWRRVEAST